MSHDVPLLMISAMYENGGNTVHRFFDGHPQMFVYPFESQLGTPMVVDQLTSLFPVKYRWPIFALNATPEADYRAIIDEECRVRARTPRVSKFRHLPFDLSDDERGELYRRYVTESGRAQGANVAAFFRATFDAWKDYWRSDEERVYVGYSPIIIVDAEKILHDMPQSHVLHVVRNPWSAYADTRKRPVPLSMLDYMIGWTLNQYHALLFRQQFPDRVHIVRLEDVLDNPRKVLGTICAALGLEAADALEVPSWNGVTLDEVYPWDTIRRATPQANRATAEELSPQERADIRALAWHYLDAFDYADFLQP
jgi:hypothetical protein